MNYTSRDFFTYSVFFNAIAAGTIGQRNLSIEQDSDFSLSKLAYYVGDLATSDGTSTTQVPGNTYDTRVIPEATIRLQDTGSGRFIMNEEVALSSLFGTGELPFILPEDKIIPARSIIAVIVRNYGASDIDNLYLSFIGMKMFL